MKLTRNQRIALGVLAFSSVALLADRTMLGPKAALADSSATQTAPIPTAPTDKSLGSPESLTANLRIVSTWKTSSTTGSEFDPFVWQLARLEQLAVTQAMTFEQVVAAWKLSTTMGTPGNRIAMINRAPVRVNEFIEFSDTDSRQAKVIEIREDTVVVYYDGRTAVVSLPVTRISGVGDGNM